MKMKHPPIFHIDVGMHPLSKEIRKEWQAHMAIYSCAEPNSRTIGKLSLSCFIQVFRYQNNNELDNKTKIIKQ